MTWPPTRLLVVGGNGFIGSHLVLHGLRLGWKVTSLSLRPPRDLPDPAVRTVAADITDRAKLASTLDTAEYEYVVNCGGYIDHTLFSKGGQSVFESHFDGVVNLVQTLDRRVLRSFINIGSSDEYGRSPAPQVETQREAPISPYSLGKAATTHFLQMMHRTESFPSTTLRLFLTYGPGQESRRMLPQVVRGCLDGRAFPTSAGEQLRDFCFAQDTVDAVFATFDHPQARGEVINIASGNPVSVREMIETVRRLVGRGTPLFGEIPYRPGENMELYADISKARALLDWTPKVALEVGLESVIRSIKEQQR